MDGVDAERGVDPRGAGGDPNAGVHTPPFIEKAVDVAGPYHDPPKLAVVLCR